METKFKVGDKVRYLENDSTLKKEGVYIVAEIHKGNSGEPNGIVLEGFGSSDWWYFSRFALARKAETKKLKKPVPPRFILQYELDADPFELFATEKEVRARIKELAGKPSLKRESIKVYEIKNVRAVKLGTSIKFTK